MSYDAPHASAVRRGPAILLAGATVVLLCAGLGLAGVLETPAARAAAAAAAPDPMVTALDDLALASGELIEALEQPADDSATPDPVNSADIPLMIGTLDPTTLPDDSGEGRRVVYSINGQRVWLVESNGSVSRTYPVSGRLDRPGPGEYEVYSRSPDAISYTGDERMQYMVRFAHGERAAIGFHDIPVDENGVEVQTVDQLGQPLSAGCIRQAEADAQVLWDWAPVGTKVVVVA